MVVFFLLPTDFIAYPFASSDASGGHISPHVDYQLLRDLLGNIFKVYLVPI